VAFCKDGNLADVSHTLETCKVGPYAQPEFYLKKYAQPESVGAATLCLPSLLTRQQCQSEFSVQFVGRMAEVVVVHRQRRATQDGKSEGDGRDLVREQPNLT
jgi:hypothetical protein